jgi:hypothetical protein
MVDIFLSYSRHDKERIVPVVKALEARGWSVWWDRKIPPGKTFDQVIEEALSTAKCVIVVWSKDSVGSEWVKTEAAEGAERKILVPVAIDNVKIPLAYRLRQSAQLAGWDGISPHPELDLLFGSVRDLIAANVTEQPNHTVDHPEEHPIWRGPDWSAAELVKPVIREKVKTWRLVVSALLILVVVVIFGWAIIAWRLRVDQARAEDDIKRNLIVEEASKIASQTPNPSHSFLGEDHALFNNWNTDIVFSNPTKPTQFSITEPTYITNIYDYHYQWNGTNPTGKGIKLRGNDGQEFGPWEVFAGSGHGEKQNVNWVCSPKITLAAGIYTVVDPDPATWSQNDQSENRGMSLVKGFLSSAR